MDLTFRPVPGRPDAVLTQYVDLFRTFRQRSYRIVVSTAIRGKSSVIPSIHFFSYYKNYVLRKNMNDGQQKYCQN